MKKKFLYLFIISIFLPIFLTITSSISSFSCDVQLAGNIENSTKPIFSLQSFWDGSYQLQYSNWFDKNLKPRGVITKTYNTIRYYFFNLGYGLLGKHKDIFEWPYVYSELCISGATDMALDENKEEMNKYIDELEQLQEKLGQCNKKLYLLVSPVKSDFHKDNIPDTYINISNPDSIKPVDYMEERLESSNLNYYIARDMRNELEYPAFYNVGIHWSRTYEQKVSAKILEDLCNLTSKKYRKIILGDVKKSKTPFWRDNDVYELQNIWFTNYDEVFYEYNEIKDQRTEYDDLRIMIQGGSFSEGLRYDISMLYPEDKVYYINRDSFIVDLDNNREYFNQNWDQLDIKTYLDKVDIIIIESTEAELTNYSHGFVQYLNDYLDTYLYDN